MRLSRTLKRSIIALASGLASIASEWRFGSFERLWKCPLTCGSPTTTTGSLAPESAGSKAASSRRRYSISSVLRSSSGASPKLCRARSAPSPERVLGRATGEDWVIC